MKFDVIKGNTLDEILANESLLIPRIQIEQNTMRLAGKPPLWTDFNQTEHWWTVKKDLSLTQTEKYRAWWELIFKFGEADHGGPVALATAYLIRERMKRGYHKTMPVTPEKYKVAPGRALAIEEFVLLNFEALNPA